jgi:LasA protease
MNRRARWAGPLLALTLLVLAALACDLGENVIEVTATPLWDGVPETVLPADQPTNTPIQPTPNPPRTVEQLSDTYTVQPDDTLNQIAELYGISAAEIMTLNNLADPNVLEVGQTLQMPTGALLTGPDIKLIPDSELVYGPTASDFDIEAFIQYRQGFLNAYSEDIGTETWSGARIIRYVAMNYSVNPRLLLALLEYRGGWLSRPYPSDEAVRFPMGIQQTGREGLLRQTLDMADALNQGYYGWKYRGITAASFGDGTRMVFASTLNPGTVGVQYALSVGSTVTLWQQDVHPSGFFQTYMSLFGDPFVRALEPIVPPNLVQPELTLPFPQGEEWVYTGGPHGAYNTGSGWSAIDFAPPKPPDDQPIESACYLSPFSVTAAAPGVVARSDDGHVVLDLDMDGNEHTGWVLLYLHIDQFERISAGVVVQTGDRLGHPSCEGGFSTGTHLHFARRYNGEWIPVQCIDCMPGVTTPALVLSAWTVYGYPGQEYQGYMVGPDGDLRLEADVRRDFEQNKIVWGVE